MITPPTNPKQAEARAAILAYQGKVAEEIITTFAGQDAPTWDAAEVEAWYRVAMRIHQEVVENLRLRSIEIEQDLL